MLSGPIRMMLPSTGTPLHNACQFACLLAVKWTVFGIRQLLHAVRGTTQKARQIVG